MSDFFLLFVLRIAEYFFNGGLNSTECLSDSLIIKKKIT